jgi:nucleoside diphosphate kinase
MAPLRILDARLAEDNAAWVDIWDSWPGHEVWAHPAYVELFARPTDRVLAAVSNDVLFPFIMRSLSEEVWAEPDESACDITSPYGYGGVFAWGRASSADPFWDELDQWAAREHVVTAFARLSVFPDQLLDHRGDIVERFPNVVRDLSASEDELWKDYAHKVRKNVNRASGLGLTVEHDASGRRLTEFLEVYEQTMDRRSANPGYYFSRQFFERLIAQLPHGLQFFYVLSEGRVVSTELVLVSAENAYSFLGGTLVAAFALRANDLLKHEVIRWAKEAGKKAFVLGGGYGAADGIFRYKLSFAPKGQRPFRVWTRIFDRAECDRLIARRSAWEHEQGRDWAPTDNFFPPYRA